MLKHLELPDFDYLKLLADTNPEELEKLRLSYSQQLIDSAPERLKHRLNGIMFAINMESRRNKSPMGTCIKISQMMMESFSHLKDALNNVGNDRHQGKDEEIDVMDNIIYFPDDNKKGHA